MKLMYSIMFFALVSYANNNAEIARKANSHTVELLDKDRVICAGVLVGDKGDIVTAAHCVKGIMPFYVRHKGEKYKAYPVKSNYTFDMALLRTDIKDKGAKLAQSEPDLFSSVFTIGHPAGNLYIISRGEVTRISAEKGCGIFYKSGCTLYKMHVFFGNSGGGIFNREGELISVVSQMSLAGIWMLNIAVSSTQEDTYEFVSSWINRGEK